MLAELVVAEQSTNIPLVVAVLKFLNMQRTNIPVPFVDAALAAVCELPSQTKPCTTMAVTVSHMTAVDTFN
jgi:hypothetical protein